MALGCERCLGNSAARYRVYTDALDMEVCDSCAEEAREIGIKVELLDRVNKRPRAEVKASLDCRKRG